MGVPVFNSLRKLLSRINMVALSISLSFFIILSIYAFILYRDNYFTMFDLGVSYRSAFLFISSFHFVWYPDPHQFVSGYLTQKLIYIPISFSLLIYNSPVTILVDQALVISAGGYALFSIAQELTNNKLVSYSSEGLYFLFTANYGFLTHGGNYMVFLSGFTLLSFMFFLKHRKVPALTFLVLASITNQLAPLILLVFYIIISRRYGEADESREFVLPDNQHHNKRGTLLVKKYYMIFSGVLMILFLFLVQLILNGIHPFIGNVRGTYTPSPIYLHSSTYNSLYGSFISNPFKKINFISEMMSPELFIPFFSEMLLPIAGYFLAISLLNYPGFFNLLQQYPYLVISFIFVGNILFFRRIRDRFSSRLFKRALTLLILLMLISSAYSFLNYSPFSIENVRSGALSSDFNYTTGEKQANYLYSLIPANSTVFIQNGMPQLAHVKKIYMAGFYNNQTVDYAVINPLLLNPVIDSFGGYDGYWANKFASNSSYGVYASADSITIYKLHYMGDPVYFVPTNLSIGYLSNTFNNISFNMGIAPPSFYSVTILAHGFDNVLISKIHLIFKGQNSIQTLNITNSISNPGQFSGNGIIQFPRWNAVSLNISSFYGSKLVNLTSISIHLIQS